MIRAETHRQADGRETLHLDMDHLLMLLLLLLWTAGLQTEERQNSEETVMDTRTATAELGWISFPANGWEEVRRYDENLNTITTYQVCNVLEPSQNNWLLTTYIDRRAAQRMYVEIRFTVRDCASIPMVLDSCKETFNLYYLETNRTVSEGIKGVEYWANASFLKVDTIAADESFSQVDFGGRLMKVNTEVRSFGPLSKGRGFHLAFQDLGACMSLLAVRVFYKKCPSIVHNFAFFPETLTGTESTSLVVTRGSCIPNAEEVDVPIKLYCNGDGEWMVPIGSCSCKAGYEPDNGNVCRACPQGTFKSFQGAGLCQQCPLNSRSTIEAATLCGCRNGYYRGDMDKPEDACTKSVRLLDGTSLCSGRLEVKSEQSEQPAQRWSSVCEADFDQQDAEVVCRELGCGAPSVLQGVLYGEVEAPMWTKEFQCRGHESALLDCRSSGSTRNTCSPGKAVGLTCSEPVRLVGGDSRCAGTLQVKHLGQWRPVSFNGWTLKTAAVACRDLDCGPAVSLEERKSSDRSVWRIRSDCVQSGSALRECVRSGSSSSSIVALTCSDPLVQPNISASSSVNGVSEVQQQGFLVLWGSTFTISCSIQPQYPGGSFQLTFTSSNTAHNYTQPAVNHSAHFLFPVAEPAHQGSYSCVYHVEVFSRNLSFESRQLSLTVSVSTVLVIRWVVVPLTLLLGITAIYFYYKASRGQKPGRQENVELVYMNLGVGAAEGGATEEEGAQGAE